MNLFLKKWLAGVNSTMYGTWITNHAMIWLVIFYLQINGILPSVHEIFLVREKQLNDVGGMNVPSCLLT